MTAAKLKQASFLTAPIVPTLLKLAAPNMVGFFVMSCVSIAEMWYVGELGTSALAGFAVLFPLVMLMNMLGAGSIGGVIAATTARAMGAGKIDRANRIVWHATFLAFAASVLFFGIEKIWVTDIATAIGASGESLQHATAYSNIVFSGVFTLWLFNIFSSLLRGAGDMTTPAVAMVVTAIFQILISGALSLGWFGLPAIGIAGIGYGTVIAAAVGALICFRKLLSGKSGIQFSKDCLQWDPEMAKELVKVGGLAGINPFLSISTIVLVTAMISRFGESALAGFGIGTRLEFILIPIVFGIGAAMISLVGSNIGAGQINRAQNIGWVGGGMAFLICGLIGLVVAVYPETWAGVFTDDAAVFAAAAEYLVIVGPAYAFFGLGLSLYFASQGAHAVFWPVFASVGRLVIAAGIGFYTLQNGDGDFQGLLICISASLFFYGAIPTLALALGAWKKANT
ncbi:MAG: MATE family efflux transporter [Pseudomonas marincola]